MVICFKLTSLLGVHDHQPWTCELVAPRSRLKSYRAIMLFRFVPLNFTMILQSTYSVKWSLNIRSSKSNLNPLKTSKRYFYFVVLFNNFSFL